MTPTTLQNLATLALGFLGYLADYLLTAPESFLNWKSFGVAVGTSLLAYLRKYLPKKANE